MSEILAEAPLLSFFSGISGRLELAVMGLACAIGSENRQVGQWLQAQVMLILPSVQGSGENKEEFWQLMKTRDILKARLRSPYYLVVDSRKFLRGPLTQGLHSARQLGVVFEFLGRNGNSPGFIGDALVFHAAIQGLLSQIFNGFAFRNCRGFHHQVRVECPFH